LRGCIPCENRHFSGVLEFVTEIIENRCRLYLTTHIQTYIIVKCMSVRFGEVHTRRMNRAVN
jgi:hypothetical protein